MTRLPSTDSPARMNAQPGRTPKPDWRLSAVIWPKAEFLKTTPVRTFKGANKILESRHPEPVLPFAFFSDVVRLAFELK